MLKEYYAAFQLKNSRMTQSEIFLRIGNICWAHKELPKTWRALNQAFRAGMFAFLFPQMRDSSDIRFSDKIICTCARNVSQVCSPVSFQAFRKASCSCVIHCIVSVTPISAWPTLLMAPSLSVATVSTNRQYT
jgi:hypothetical protein